MNKKPKNIEQLYSESFNDFRVEPSSGLWKSISTKLAWRNFFSFTPTTLNAYYVAGLLTLATAGVLLLTKPAIETNKNINEITINNTIEKPIVTAVQKTQENLSTEVSSTTEASAKAVTKAESQKPASSSVVLTKEDSSSVVLTKEDSSSVVSSTAEASAKAVTKEDNPKLVTPDPELVTRIVSRSEAKVDNSQPVTPNSQLATPHPKPTQHPALSSEVLTKEDTQHQAPGTNLPDPWPNMDTLFTNNTPTPPEYKIQFPNAFTPNTNGPTNGYYTPGIPNNDVFHPVFKGVVEYHLSIFNRRGELIFECNDINVGWDGYINDRLAAQGVYVWKARGKYSNGENFVKLGNVMLIKK